MNKPASSTSPAPSSALVALMRGVGKMLAVFQYIFATAALVVLICCAVPYVRKAMQPVPQTLPPTMEEVNWHDPQSSSYCLACHKQVGLAIGGTEVERGHSQNVPLASQQIEAVHDMGTDAGPGDTLICMSCHQLERNTDNPHMLADTVKDSQLCQRCHPGHYARGTPHDLRISAPDEQNRIGQTVEEGGPCSACHLSHQHARRIERSPRDPDGYCIPCHSAYGIASEHARLTMDHPESHCGECHDPHDMSNGEFLAQPIGELCISCHEGYGSGIGGGMHPLGPMDKPVPEELIAAGAHTMGNPQQLTCIVCHDTHEAKHNALLHMTPDENRLCLTCHEDKLLANGGESILPKHGQQPVLNDEQQAVVKRWGNSVGPNGELLCVSCHGPHNAHADTKLLSFAPKYGETCSACHPQHEGVAGSPHDLRVKFPDLANSAGLTPDAGVCSPCHMAHQFPRERVATPGDPGGQCVTCHREGDCGETRLTGGADHPDTACIECHDPHNRENEYFLVAPPNELCRKCHEQQYNLAGGPHDVSRNPDVWQDDAVAAGGPCLSCHVPHGGERPDLFRYRTPTGFGNHDGVCLACHEEEGWDENSNLAAIHPREIKPEHSQVDLALVPVDAHGDRRMGCRTCHDPHGGDHPVHLARVKENETTEQLCLHCHTEKRLIRFTGHSPESLSNAGYKVDSCKPCHAMHASPGGSWGELLSPRFLLEYCKAEGDDPAKCLPCLACHMAEGPAPKRTFTQHPEVLTMNVFDPLAPGYMPLFMADGRVDPQGQVTCRTCHISHGRSELLTLMEQNRELTAEQREALKAQVRPFFAPNVCTTCHGPQARTLFLYFHEPARRPEPVILESKDSRS